MNQVEQLLRFLVGNDELDFDYLRALQIKELFLDELVIASEAGHGAKRRSAANPKLVGAHEQPFPDDAVMVPLTFVDVEP
jgi:hypothetical protein